ncbi:MAG: type II toxin-antitoxin system RelE/ParE family toxin [Xanthobacteraceae bacterium]
MTIIFSATTCRLTISARGGFSNCTTTPFRHAWIGTAKEDLLAFTNGVVREIGHALYIAQIGGKHASAKPLKGFGGGTVLEIVENFDGDTYRAVYTVRFAEAIYVLHAFQKKSKKGIKTPQREMDKVESRLQRAQQEHAAWQKTKQ